MEGDLLHRRDIKVEAFEMADKQARLVGHLTDWHPEAVEPISGEVYPAQVVHDITLELEISLKDFRINAVRGKMDSVPYPVCREVLQKLDDIVGLNVMAGFMRNMKQQMGGPNNCAHFVCLLTTMAPVVMQAAGGPAKVDISSLTDTCYGWRADGPLVPALRKKLAKNSAAPSVER